MSYLFKLINQLFEGINHVISSMDTTQWGIFATIMVVVGFMALRSRI